jgi:hypothetical protein
MRGQDAFVHWRIPTQTLFDLGEMFANKAKWGKLVEAYLTLVRHLTMRPAIVSLRTKRQIDLIPSLRSSPS